MVYEFSLGVSWELSLLRWSASIMYYEDDLVRSLPFAYVFSLIVMGGRWFPASGFVYVDCCAFLHNLMRYLPFVNPNSCALDIASVVVPATF